jgi:rod shape-determining protein MreD
VRWAIFIGFGIAALVLDVSLGQVLLLRSLGNIAPSFVAVLLVFVSLFAPRVQALWACWVMGVLVDLSIDLPHGTDLAGPFIGPHALGYLFACFVLLQVRAMLFRRRALTMAVTTILFALSAGLVAIFVYVVHGWFPTEELTWGDLRPTSELMRRAGAAVYSGLLAFVVARPLMWTAPLWGFRTAGPRGGPWRGPM